MERNENTLQKEWVPFCLCFKLTHEINGIRNSIFFPLIINKCLRCPHEIPLVFKSELYSLAFLFPQLSVLFLLTLRTNEQTATDTLHSPSSIYHLLSVASLYLLVLSSFHLNTHIFFPAKLLFTNIIFGCFMAPFRNGGWKKKMEK